MWSTSYVALTPQYKQALTVERHKIDKKAGTDCGFMPNLSAINHALAPSLGPRPGNWSTQLHTTNLMSRGIRLRQIAKRWSGMCRTRPGHLDKLSTFTTSVLSQMTYALCAVTSTFELASYTPLEVVLYINVCEDFDTSTDPRNALSVNRWLGNGQSSRSAEGSQCSHLRIDSIARSLNR